MHNMKLILNIAPQSASTPMHVYPGSCQFANLEFPPNLAKILTKSSQAVKDRFAPQVISSPKVQVALIGHEK